MKEPWRTDVRRARQCTTHFYSPFSAFTNGIMLTWNYSIYKTVLPELVAWLVLFMIISLTYRFVDRQSQNHMEVWFEYWYVFNGYFFFFF